MIDDIDSILNGIEVAENSFTSDIKKYWSYINGADDIQTLVSVHISKMKEKLPRVPMKEWEELIKEYDIPSMEGDFVNQFMAHFTHEELKSLLKLYDENPLLKKAREQNKIIMNETYKLNEKWTHHLIRLMNEKIRKWSDMGYIDSDNM